MIGSQLTFDDICAGRHGGNPESVAANPRSDTKARDQAAILMELERCGERGATCDELEWQTGLSHQTCSARCSELKASGDVVTKPVGWNAYEKRRTRSGKLAAVLILAALAPEGWKTPPKENCPF
jgi:hypothetical protein